MFALNDAISLLLMSNLLQTTLICLLQSRPDPLPSAGFKRFPIHYISPLLEGFSSTIIKYFLSSFLHPTELVE